MGTYLIPRDTKGEGRILFIFSKKALIYTFVGAFVGFLLYQLMKLINLNVIGIILLVIFALLGFGIGTFKMPNTTAFEITKKTGGENIDDVIIRAIKFKMKNKNKIYVYTEEERKWMNNYNK